MKKCTPMAVFTFSATLLPQHRQQSTMRMGTVKKRDDTIHSQMGSVSSYLMPLTVSNRQNSTALGQWNAPEKPAMYSLPPLDGHLYQVTSPPIWSWIANWR